MTEGTNRRDFLAIVTGMVAGLGGIAAAIPFINSMLPSRDVEATRTSTIDISEVKEGELVTFEWQGKPVFVVHRNKEQIHKAQSTQPSRDPQADKDRVKKPEWLIVVGICTHLGCIPEFRPEGDRMLLCPCHGSIYDYSARIIAGPAPKNLEVPVYKFESDTKVLIGEA